MVVAARVVPGPAVGDAIEEGELMGSWLALEFKSPLASGEGVFLNRDATEVAEATESGVDDAERTRGFSEVEGVEGPVAEASADFVVPDPDADLLFHTTNAPARTTRSSATSPPAACVYADADAGWRLVSAGVKRRGLPGGRFAEVGGMV